MAHRRVRLKPLKLNFSIGAPISEFLGYGIKSVQQKQIFLCSGDLDMLIVTALVNTHRTLKGRVCTPVDPIVGLLNHCIPCSFNILYYDPCPDFPRVFLLSGYPNARVRTHKCVNFDRYI